MSDRKKERKKEKKRKKISQALYKPRHIFATFRDIFLIKNPRPSPSNVELSACQIMYVNNLLV
jgi:hypothetical protein